MPPDATQADAAEEPQAGTQSQADTTEPTDGDGDTQPQTISLEEARKLRSEAQGLRKRLKVFEDEKKAAEDAKRSEAEKLAEERRAFEAERQAFTNERRAARTAAAVEEAARKAGFRYPAKAFRLLDPDSLGIDEEGNPTTADKALKALAAEMPELVVTGSSSATNPDRRVGAKPRYTREDIAKMSAAEIAKIPKPELAEAMRS